MTHSFTDLRNVMKGAAEEPLMDFKKTNFSFGNHTQTTLCLKSSALNASTQKEMYEMKGRKSTQKLFDQIANMGKSSKIVLGRDSSANNLDSLYQKSFTWKVPRFAV